MKEKLYTYCAIRTGLGEVDSLSGWGPAATEAEAIGLSTKRFKETFGCHPQSVEVFEIDIERLKTVLRRMGEI
jgi:hypothetical protein